MAIPAEHSKVECWDDNGNPYLKEYVGTDKLKGKKVIITGGDSVSLRSGINIFIHVIDQRRVLDGQ